MYSNYSTEFVCSSFGRNKQGQVVDLSTDYPNAIGSTKYVTFHPKIASNCNTTKAHIKCTSFMFWLLKTIIIHDHLQTVSNVLLWGILINVAQKGCTLYDSMMELCHVIMQQQQCIRPNLTPFDKDSHWDCIQELGAILEDIIKQNHHIVKEIGINGSIFGCIKQNNQSL